MSADPRRRIVLEAERLRSRRGRGARAFELRVEELALCAGEVLVILGPNGSGKSSLLRALAGVDPILGEGGVRHHGSGTVGLVFQRPAALSGSVWHNVRAALLGRRMSRRERRDRVRSALDRFEIGELAGHDARTLSGGELRRLALARAFVVEPEVLLLDEPFDDLDAEGQRSLSLDLQRAIAETGVAVAVVTHDLRRALLLADRIAVLEGGRLAQVGSRDEVLLRPLTPQVARRVGMLNVIVGEVVRREADVAWVGIGPGLEVPAVSSYPVGASVWVGIRPEHLEVGVGGGTGLEIGPARIESLVSDGLVTVATLRMSSHVLTTHFLAGRGLARRLTVGDRVSLEIDPAKVQIRPSERTGGPGHSGGGPERTGVSAQESRAEVRAEEPARRRAPDDRGQLA